MIKETDDHRIPFYIIYYLLMLCLILKKKEVPPLRPVQLKNNPREAGSSELPNVSPNVCKPILPLILIAALTSPLLT